MDEEIWLEKLEKVEGSLLVIDKLLQRERNAQKIQELYSQRVKLEKSYDELYRLFTN